MSNIIVIRTGPKNEHGVRGIGALAFAFRVVIA